eukprot:TRINITY_DN4772_c0_g2_i2.p1 TRINITY_DN4772_c0_g2~~TRINITY_DN4772_c0_g2_i2.p1  ORF type:complete len:251 (+),score=55.94 TRINITY_DN4772_c0_g2_i2:258-1010(+)
MFPRSELPQSKQKKKTKNKMMRYFGLAKPKTPGPTLEEVSGNTDKRIQAVEEKIKRLDVDLVKYREQMKRMRPGPAQNAVKQKAMKILQQKRLYENQRDQMMGQQWNIDQTIMTHNTMKDTVHVVGAMKDANQAMRKTMKDIKIESVEALHDEMEDMFLDSNDIQDVLAKSYAVPDDVDEADLEAELDALGDEVMMDEEPSYLQATTAPMSETSLTSPTQISNAPSTRNAAPLEFNLPSVPQNSSLERGW